MGDGGGKKNPNRNTIGIQSWPLTQQRKKGNPSPCIVCSSWRTLHPNSRKGLSMGNGQANLMEPLLSYTWSSFNCYRQQSLGVWVWTSESICRVKTQFHYFIS
jgi:hypothetical protein